LIRESMNVAMRDKPIEVWGLGRIVHDARYALSLGNRLAYIGSRAGGSVWNALANVAARGHGTGGLGVAGDDARADLALADNSTLGIDMTRIYRATGRPTLTMHNFPVPRAGQSHEYRTRPRCPICSGLPRSAVLDDGAEIVGGAARVRLGPAVLLVDKMTNRTTSWARQLRARGWTAALDIGYPGYLYPRSIGTLRAQLNSFDVIVMQATVARFLVRRLDDSIAVLAEHAGAVVVVSEGAHGLHGFDGRSTSASGFEVAAPRCTVIDTLGAGDALMGGIITALVDSGHRHGPIHAEPAAIHQWCRQAVDELPPVLASVGPRGHLPGEPVSLPLDAGGSECRICGASRAPQRVFA